MKLRVDKPLHKVFLLLQALNFRGRTTHLGQFPLSFEQDVLTTDVLGSSTSYVPASQGPFVAMMFAHGVMQVIHWYGRRNILLSEKRIKALLLEVKTMWRGMNRMDRMAETR
jgi:hypothetical protein